MKVRTGFVSNSSSSSFCIYGAYFDSLEEMAEALGLDEVPKNTWDADTKGLSIWDISDYASSPEIFVGRQWSSIRDDETGAEFKRSVEEKFTGAKGVKLCSTHEEAWYNG